MAREPRAVGGKPRIQPEKAAKTEVILAVRTEAGTVIPVGFANVEFNEDGEPDTLFHKKKVEYEDCGHSYWALIAPSAESFVEQLDHYIIWRGPYSNVGESLLEWFMLKVHEGHITH